MATPDRPEPKDPRGKDVPGTQALMRGIDVLMTIGTAPRAPRFGDILAEVQLPNGTLHRLLAALQRRRLVRYDDRARTYSLGPGVLELARHSLDQSEIIRAAKPELARVARQLGRAICLYVRDGDEVFVSDFEDPDAANSRVVRVWPRQPAASSAAGQAILALMPPEQRATLTGQTSEAEVGLVQALGYRLQSGSAAPAIAAPVRDAAGYPVAAIGCQMDAGTMPAEYLHEVGRKLAEAARRATGNLGMGVHGAEVLPERPGPVDRRVTVLNQGRDFMGENPVWLPTPGGGRLLWLDILAPALRELRPADGSAERIELSELTGGLAPASDGRLILLGQSGIFAFDEATRKTTLLVSPEAHRPDNRFNTAGIDAHGNIWAATMAIDHSPGRGALYRITPDLEVRQVLDRLDLPKNPAWSADGTRMYLGDGNRGVVQVFDFDAESGRLGPGRDFIHGAPDQGLPNGIAVDAEDHVWVAMLGGWAVHRYAPDGRLVDRVVLPVPMPTAVSFGGPDLQTLYVTSTYLRLPPGFSTIAPLSGNLMTVAAGVAGQPPRTFGGAT